MTNKEAALPKLRVTCLICTAELPQCAQRRSEDIDGDDDELAAEADLDDGLRPTSVENDAGDDNFAFVGFCVTLALDDLPREDDISRSRIERLSSSSSSAAWAETT